MTKIALQKRMEIETLYLTLMYWREILVESMRVMKMIMDEDLDVDEAALADAPDAQLSTK